VLAGLAHTEMSGSNAKSAALILRNQAEYREKRDAFFGGAKKNDGLAVYV